MQTISNVLSNPNTVISYFTKERVDTVIVTGCVTSGCIRASVIDSFQYGFRTIVPEDCVSDHEAGPHRDNLRDVARRYCDITTCDEAIEYLDGVAHPEPVMREQQPSVRAHKRELDQWRGSDVGFSANIGRKSARLGTFACSRDRTVVGLRESSF